MKGLQIVALNLGIHLMLLAIFGAGAALGANVVYAYFREDVEVE